MSRRVRFGAAGPATYTDGTPVRGLLAGADTCGTRRVAASKRVGSNRDAGVADGRAGTAGTCSVTPSPAGFTATTGTRAVAGSAAGASGVAATSGIRAVAGSAAGFSGASGTTATTGTRAVAGSTGIALDGRGGATTGIADVTPSLAGPRRPFRAGTRAVASLGARGEAGTGRNGPGWVGASRGGAGRGGAGAAGRAEPGRGRPGRGVAGRRDDRDPSGRALDRGAGASTRGAGPSLRSAGTEVIREAARSGAGRGADRPA